MSVRKKISLIIPTYNRGEKLMGTLDSLLVQTLPSGLWELVVINNNSTDDTIRLFTEYMERHPQLDARMVTETQQGVSAARNRGIAESKGEYIVAIDDDEVVVPDFLKQYYDLFESDGSVTAAGGRILPRFDGDVPSWMSKYTERAIAGTLDLGDEIIDFPKNKFFGGGNHGYRKSVVEKYGGYNTELGRTGGKMLAAEEKEFYFRLIEGGEHIVYLPDAVIYHIIEPARLTREYFVNICRNIGRSERMRTLAVSRGKYAERLLMELVKWCGALVLALGYCLRFQPSKGHYLIIMRHYITGGLLGK